MKYEELKSRLNCIVMEERKKSHNLKVNFLSENSSSEKCLKMSRFFFKRFSLHENSQVPFLMENGEFSCIHVELFYFANVISPKLFTRHSIERALFKASLSQHWEKIIILHATETNVTWNVDGSALNVSFFLKKMCEHFSNLSRHAVKLVESF